MSIPLLEKLNWRYATKKMDPSKKVEPEKLELILEAIRMAPTSSGTQPFEVFVVKNPELRDKIRAVGWDQAQITEASDLLVFAAWDNYSTDRIDGVVAQMEDERGKSEMLTGYFENLKGMYLPRDAEVNYNHAARQAYIALGFALIAAAEAGVDSTPMEGFDPEQVDEILGLKEKGLRSVILLPVGYRQEDQDWLVNMKKVRKSKETLITEIN
ncbi:MAG: NAD(P)H-dependent oxidoreductase [Pelagimonas sp.]